jgi:DNA-binding transcriptional ArsR family regulator
MEEKVEVGRLDKGKQCRSAAVTEANELRLDESSVTRGWTFITNHTQVLLAVAQQPDLRVREIATAANITERHAYRMLRDLQEAGYVERRRDGRCNVYRINPELAIGDPVVEEQSLRELLRLIGKGESDESPSGFGFARALRAVDPR